MVTTLWKIFFKSRRFSIKNKKKWIKLSFIYWFFSFRFSRKKMYGYTVNTEKISLFNRHTQWIVIYELFRLPREFSLVCIHFHGKLFDLVTGFFEFFILFFSFANRTQKKEHFFRLLNQYYCWCLFWRSQSLFYRHLVFHSLIIHNNTFFCCRLSENIYELYLRIS